MDRRTFIGGVADGVFACNRIAHAQQSGKLWRVEFLQGSARPPDGAPPAALRNQLQALGFEQGKDIVYEGRWAEARNARLPALAAKLLALKVE